jgi:hypothetical protein
MVGAFCRAIGWAMIYVEGLHFEFDQAKADRLLNELPQLAPLTLPLQ